MMKKISIVKVDGFFSKSKLYQVLHKELMVPKELIYSYIKKADKFGRIDLEADISIERIIELQSLLKDLGFYIVEDEDNERRILTEEEINQSLVAIFEDDPNLKNYCINDLGLIIYKPFNSVIVIEDNNVFDRIKLLLKECC